MAGDWIRMRVWLSRDPRVIAMADDLADRKNFMDWLTSPFQTSCESNAHEYVTRDVTVALCVTSLLVTWGTAREQGARDGDDLIVTFMDANTVSRVAGVPGFGEAMASVGWLVEEIGKRARFPKFFSAKASPSERHGEGSAERMRRLRERRKKKSDEKGDGSDGVTSLSHVTVRGEKRREEIKNTHTARTRSDEGESCDVGVAMEVAPGVEVDWLISESAFMARWNATQGVTHYSMTKVPQDCVRAFQDRYLESGWLERAERALAKFPLASGNVMTIGTFLKQGKVDELLGGSNDWKPGRSRASPGHRKSVAEHNAEVFKEVFGDDDDGDEIDSGRRQGGSPPLLHGPDDSP